MQENYYADLKLSSNRLGFAKEFGTIKMCTSRRAGHSTAIAKLVNEFNDKNWVVISNTCQMLVHLHKLITRCAEQDGNNIKFCTPSHIEFENGSLDLIGIDSADRYLRGREFDGIIVDCAFWLSQSKIDKLYEVGIPCMQFKPHVIFIFVE
jgi:hypothetical protein